MGYTRPQGLGRIAQIGATATLVLAGAGVGFTIQNSGNDQVFTVTPTGVVRSSGAIIAGGVDLSKKVAVIPLYGSGTTTATGTSVGIAKMEMQFDGYISGIHANVGEAADDNLTTLQVQINDTNALSTPVTIDATETSSRTAAAAAVISSTASGFVAGDILTFDVLTPANTPAKAMNANLIVTATSLE